MADDQDARREPPASGLADPTRDIRLPPLPGTSPPDLPPEWRAGQERGQRLVGPPQGQRPAFPPEVAWLVPLVVIVTGVMLLAVLTRGFWFFPWPLLWIFFFAFGRRGRAGWRPPRW